MDQELKLMIGQNRRVYRGLRAVISEEGWPCQRLRMAFSLILFFVFERYIGQRLPAAMPFIALGTGFACLVSAMHAIQSWKAAAHLSVLKAIESRAT